MSVNFTADVRPLLNLRISSVVSWVRERLSGVRREHVHAGAKVTLALALVFAGTLAVKDALSKEMARAQTDDIVKAASGGFTDRELQVLMEGAGPSVWRIASSSQADIWRSISHRPPGWKLLDITTPPRLDLGGLSMDDARRINGAIPLSEIENPPAAPFVLAASSPERAAAVQCLTTAIYYEAALEPRAGQEAVAQVILNRMRHTDYPKSVCGVVFQGSDRPGCQFSFACDGSMARTPAQWAWRNAKDVAEQALNGYVMKEVGVATHYHTSWIVASWTPTVLKVAQIGAHIFFRPTGPEGQPAAFHLAYAGGESRASKTYLIGKPQVIPQALPQLFQISTPQGSVVVPRTVTIGGRTIVLPPSAVVLGRVHGVIGDDGRFQAGVAPMHQMIALRAAMIQAARQSYRQNPSAAAPEFAAPEPAAAPMAATAPAKPVRAAVAPARPVASPAPADSTASAAASAAG